MEQAHGGTGQVESDTEQAGGALAGRSDAPSGSLGHFREHSATTASARAPPAGRGGGAAGPVPAGSARVGHGVPVAAAADEAGDHLSQERPAHLHLRLLGERWAATAPPCPGPTTCRGRSALSRQSRTTAAFLSPRCRVSCCWPWASGAGSAWPSTSPCWTRRPPMSPSSWWALAPSLSFWAPLAASPPAAAAPGCSSW